MLQVGASHRCITPPLGTRMAGYRARTAGAARVHDDLYVRVLAFDDGRRRGAIASLDVMGVDATWVDELRTRATETVEADPHALLVAATHTHAAQGGLFRPDRPLGHAFDVMMGDGAAPYDAVMAEWLLRQTLTAVRLAFDRLVPATLSVAEGPVEGIAANRVWFERAADPRCLVLAALDADGNTVGQLIHFNCHPTVLGQDDLGVSGDFPGIATRLLENATGAPTLFLNGALGDVSTRSTRRAQSYAEAVRLGRILAGGALGLLGALDPSDAQLIEWSSEMVSLEPRSNSWLAPIEDRIADLEAAGSGSHQAARVLYTAREGAQSARRAGAILSTLAGVDIELQAVRVGDVGLVAIPGEIFSSAQADLEAALPGKRVRIVAPANGYFGYFPSAEAYDYGGYEVGVSLVERGSGELITARAALLLGAAQAPPVGARG